MKINCDVIMDLLPLYHDGVCNDASRVLVEEHVVQCASCTAILGKIRDNTLDNRIAVERGDVVGQHTRKVKRSSFIVGATIAGILMIPVLVTMIVNLAVGQALDWFFIVLTSLMLVASITVVPLVFEKNKGLWTLGSFTGSLLMLLLTITIYSGGNWFLMAAIPILFSVSVIFGPYVISKLPLTGFASRHKGLLAMAINTALLYAVVIASIIYTQSGAGQWRIAILITTVNVIYPWLMFLTIRYLKLSALIKTGLCFIISGVFMSQIGSIVDWIISGIWQSRITGANLITWGNVTITNANIHILILLTGCIVGGILVAVGLLQRRKIINNMHQ